MNRKAVEYAAVAITGAVVGYYLYKSMDKINLNNLDTPAPVEVKPLLKSHHNPPLRKGDRITYTYTLIFDD